MNVAAVPEPVQRAIDARLQGSDEILARISDRDATLWAPVGIPEVADRLGWLTIADRMLAEPPDLDGLGEFSKVVLLGMGGSSLAPEVFRSALERSGGASAGAQLTILDTTDPQTVAGIDPEGALFIVSSKSGGTIEPNSMLAHFRALVPDPKRFVAITDPGTKLNELAESEGFARVFLSDPEIGGRYSALSPFGIVPAALAGIDVGKVLEGGVRAGEQANLRLGVTLGELARAGRDKLGFVVDPPLTSFGLWAEQLVAESTGKQGRGILPIADEPLVKPSAYGRDRIFFYLRNKSAPDAANESAIEALTAAGHPAITLDADGLADLGRIFFTLEFATAVAGWVLEINPFDQPNVQEAKDNTAKVLATGAPELEDGAVGELLAGAAPPDYVAIMGYLPYDDSIDAAVAKLRAKLIERYSVATTWGYGPRFLHSTGQFHKGGPPIGRFIQLVTDSTDDLEIPGQQFTFRTLIDAQADGDLQTLRSHDLPAVRVRLKAGDLAGAITRMQEGI